MNSATMNTLMTLIAAEMPSMSAPELVCTIVLAQATIGSSRRRAWLTYADFKERTMFSGSTAIANALQAVIVRGFFRRRSGEGSIWELGEKAASLPMLAEEDTLPAGQDTLPAGQDTPPPGQDTPPPGQDTPPPGQDTPPAGQDVLLGINASTETGLQNGPKSTETVPLPYNKEKDPYGQDLVSREEREPTPQNGRPPAPPLAGLGNKDSPSGKNEQPVMPRPRTAAQVALAQHPAAQAWLAAGLPWPGWQRLKMITDRIGRQPQLDQLSQAWQMWLMAGYRPGNIGGILDWYESLCRDPTWRPFYRTGGHTGPIPPPQQAGAGPPPDPTMAMLLRMYEEEKDGKQSNGYGMFDITDFGLSADADWRGDRGGLQAGSG